MIGLTQERDGTWSSQNSAAHPFLKWAGGKGQLLSTIRQLVPRSFDRYFEPFVGGAAVFFALQPKRAVLADINDELADCYVAVRDCVEDVVVALGSHWYDEAHYYETRRLDRRTLILADRAARTIYLNRCGFNGLYRVNRKGEFNVPFGSYANPTICDAANLRACAALLVGTEIVAADFEVVLAKAVAGDFVYLDPPYVPASATANFTRYAPGGFGMLDQRRVARVFNDLVRRGVSVLLSNSDTEEVRALFREHEVVAVSASRSLNVRGSGRGKVGEVLVLGYQP